MRKILLTGGSSSVGRNLLESDLPVKYEIYAPRSRELDLTDSKAVRSFFQKNKFDVVIHSAIRPGHRNAGSLDGFMEANMAMFNNLAACRDSYGIFLNIGSGAVYDVSRDNRRVRETDLRPPEGDNLTTKYKYALHQAIERLDNFYDFNLFGFFGRYEDWEIRFISNAICKTLFDLPITLRQDRIFSYLWAEDLAQVLEHFIEKEEKPAHKFYNVVPDEEISLLQAAEIVADIAEQKTGTRPEIRIAHTGMGRSYSGDNSRLKAEMPEIRFTPYRIAIEKLYSWYEANKGMIDRNLLLKDK